MSLRLVTSLAALAALVAALGASSAQADPTRHRSKYGIQCEVWYQPYASGSGVMRFGIRNNYDSDRNIVETDRGWLDGVASASCGFPIIGPQPSIPHRRAAWGLTKLARRWGACGSRRRSDHGSCFLHDDWVPRRMRARASE
jgi:hypothetical protein